MASASSPTSPSIAALPPSPPSTMQARSSQADLVLNLLSGSAGGAAQVVVGQPLDTIKTRAQTAPRGQFKGALDVAKQTIQKEGFLALYKGMMSPLLGIAAVNSLLFTAYMQAKKLVSPYGELSIAQIAIAGGIAGGVNAILASPVEMFKIKMQGQYGGAADKKLGAVVKQTFQDHGFRQGVMRGFKVTFFREIPAYAGFYSAYETSKRYFQNQVFPGQQLPVWATLTAGGTGGIAYWLASYPLDLVKSKVQLQANPPPSGYITKELRTIVAENGVSGLFRGLTPCLIRAVPAAASTFVAFEITHKFLVGQGF